MAFTTTKTFQWHLRTFDRWAFDTWFLQNQDLWWLVKMADLSNRYLKSVHSFSETHFKSGQASTAEQCFRRTQIIGIVADLRRDMEVCIRSVKSSSRTHQSCNIVINTLSTYMYILFACHYLSSGSPLFWEVLHLWNLLRGAQMSPEVITSMNFGQNNFASY